MILHGEYVGIRNRLKGKTALVQEKHNGYVAQFDDVRTRLGYGWHWFPKSAFKIYGGGKWS